MKLIFEMAIINIIFISFTGCSTLFNRAHQGILVRTSDIEENVQIEITTSDGAYLAKTPTVILAESSWSGVQIHVIDPCYHPVVYEVPTTIDLSYWGNILWTHSFFFFSPVGLVYFAVDPISGYLWKYDTHALIPVKRRDGPKESCEKN